MGRNYGFDVIDGTRVPQLAIDRDHVLTGIHSGTVHVEAGHFVLDGTLQGTLDIQHAVKASIRGTQQGTVTMGSGSIVTVTGAIQGSTAVERGATLIIEPAGKLAGVLVNNGRVILRGVLAGPHSGTGELTVEASGHIKQPTIRDGISYYEQ